ncbi:uncharacterized protein [Amphiura filiformis]|uniref:uncharacterized protein n=1 Tax=Amphiura filiformis TaxID=82378 RepID=UPI003B2145B4
MDTNNRGCRVGHQDKPGRRGHCTGHTMRRLKTEDCGYPRGYQTYRGQFTIHKIVRSNGTQQDEIKAICEEFSNYVDDGGLEPSSGSIETARDSAWNAWSGIYASTDIPYSLNKRKRWLLAEELQRNICAVNNLENLDFKTVLVERDLTMSNGCPRRATRPDCVRVCESHTDRPEVLPNQKYALASQLRLKSKGLIGVHRKEETSPWRDLPPDETEPEPVELYYEICYPRQDENSQWRKEAHVYKKMVNETKPASKQKGQRVKNYKYWHGLCDTHSFKQDICERLWDECEMEVEKEDQHMLEEQAIPRSSPSLGMVVDHLLKRSYKKAKRRRKCKKSVYDENSEYINTNSASSNPVKMFGKKATIYEEKSDTSDDNSAVEEPAPNDAATVTIDEPFPHHDELDIKPTTMLRLATQTILPGQLKNTFGCAYIESMCQPRRFAIDVSQRLSAPASRQVYALFEVIDDNNRNNICCNLFNAEGQQMEEFVNARMTVIINPHFGTINESDLSEAWHARNGLVHTVLDVVQWLTNMVDDMRANNNDETKSQKKLSSKYAISMETVTKANGWELRVDRPDGIFREIQEESEDTDICDMQPDVTNAFNPFCGICYEILQPACGGVEAAALNACGHWFCNECWMQHLRSRVKQGDFNIICPAYDCKSAADIVTKMSFMSTSDFFRHLDHMKDAAIRRKTEWQWCPNPKCGRMACVVAGSGSVAVNCECGWLWCSLCMQDAHWPATCKQAAGYRKLVKQMVPRMKNRAPPIVSVEVKRCPKCKYPIEKNGGCPHMSCRMCGSSFCWMCLGEWNLHGWSGINIKCPKTKITTQTVWLDDDKKSAYTLSELAMHHRELRTKSVMRRYEENVYRLTAREFLKKSRATQSSRPSLNPLIWDDSGEYLPVTWASTTHSLASLIRKSSQRQELVKFCFEAHFVLEFMAVYLSDKSLTRKHRKPFTVVTDRLEFITARLDELLGAKSNFGQARLLTHAGKTCIEQLAHQMKKQETAGKSN